MLNRWGCYGCEQCIEAITVMRRVPGTLVFWSSSQYPLPCLNVCCCLCAVIKSGNHDCVEVAVMEVQTEAFSWNLRRMEIRNVWCVQMVHEIKAPRDVLIGDVN